MSAWVRPSRIEAQDVSLQLQVLNFFPALSGGSWASWTGHDAILPEEGRRWVDWSIREPLLRCAQSGDGRLHAVPVGR